MSDDIPTTIEEIKARGTNGIGFSNDLLRSWGVPVPPPKGWQRMLVAGMFPRPAEPVRRLSVVAPEEEGTIPFVEANERAKALWDEARASYARLLSQAGSLATPLFKRDGITRGRLIAARHPADQMLKHAQELAVAIAACQDLLERTEPPE